MACAYSDAKRNADRVAERIFGMKLQPGAMDDGEYWIFPWAAETEEHPIGVHKRSGGICLYDPEAHPAFREAAPYQP